MNEESRQYPYRATSLNSARVSTRPVRNLFAVVRVMKENIEPVALDAARAAWQACQGADLIVHTFLFTLGGHAFARQLDIPDVSVQFFPMYFASSSYPQIGFPDLHLGPFYNRLTHHFGNAVFAGTQRAMYPRVRKAAPEFPARLAWPFKASAGRAATPLLLAYSPALIPPEPDWGSHVHATGFWFLDSPASYQPPPELADFLAGGPPPVCIGFGSSIHPNSLLLQRALLDGLRQAGQRAVILTGWDGWTASEPGPDRLYIKAPRMTGSFRAAPLSFIIVEPAPPPPHCVRADPKWCCRWHLTSPFGPGECTPPEPARLPWMCAN